MMAYADSSYAEDKNDIRLQFGVIFVQTSAVNVQCISRVRNVNNSC